MLRLNDNEIQGSCDKIIITIVPNYAKNQKKNHLFVAVGIVRTHNYKDGNKLVIFSGIALYYGDNYNYIIVNANKTRHKNVASFPSHSQILSRSCGTAAR